jgi:hypothetical protein
VNADLYESLHEARRSLANLWWTARDQASEVPSCSADSSLRVIDNAASELAMQLNHIEEAIHALTSEVQP